ncbi:uncharacterized protein BX664DRAFT_106907, partial [Halteromyces radiatus]|uniref:uncharacterized protein n=1 Tax=Halteromyces radiatus TaxID=101107 RepID=UPI00221FBE0D
FPFISSIQLYTSFCKYYFIIYIHTHTLLISQKTLFHIIQMPTFLSSSSSSPSPRPSLSESALPSRRVLLRTTNNNNQVTSSTNGIRPARFLKPSTSSTIQNDNNNNVTPNMDQFLNLFDVYSQKVYMEGYLMQQGKKYFVELCGCTLSLWDTDRPGTIVTPDYIPIMVDTKANPTLRQQFTLDLSHKKKSMLFDTLDPDSLTKWICALRLACFERQLLHQFFTLHLFSHSDLTCTSSSSAGHLQVLLPNSKKEWKKLWVIITDNNNTTNTNATTKKSKILGKQDTANSFSLSTTSGPRLVILDSKKSKTPLLCLTRINHAYAVYPEVPSLIAQSTLIRLEGVQQDDQPIDLLLMADSSKHMTLWLSTLYNAFNLYGRPQSLIQDPTDPMALNFGEPTFNDSNAGFDVNHPWWLNTDDVVQDMDVFASMTRLEIYHRLVKTLQRKQSTSTSFQHDNNDNNNLSYPQQRANSLPLITVESSDTPRQRSTSDAGILDEPALKSALHSQVADSSDESDDNADDDDDDDELDDEPDSDDEPIGKNKPTKPTSSTNAFSSLLIPDFDFGNGFDTDRRASSSSSSFLLSGISSPTSSSTGTRPSSRQQKRQQQQQHSSSGSGSSGSSTTSSSGNSITLNKKSSLLPTPPQPSPTSSSLFGDFSLTTDFNKYLDPALNSPSAADRKYSLPSKLYSMNHPSGFDRRRSSWENQHDLMSGNHYGWDNRSPRSRYLDEDYLYHDGDDEGKNGDDDDEEDEDDDGETDDYDRDGPLIPALNDHFAPRNSLLDNHAGEQLSAKEQIEYARATGQPLIQVPSKPKPPKGGLVGVISQREQNRRQGNGTRVAERVHQHHADRFEREKERRILEQRHQQYMKHQIMMYAANGYVHPMMMHPYMTTPPPMMGSPLTPMMPPGSPYSSTSSPVTPTSPMPPINGYPSNGYLDTRPYSPSGTYVNPMMRPSSPSSPYQTSASYSGSSASTGRRHSRPLLSEDEDEPLYSPQMAHRTMSPQFHRKMQPAPSSSCNSSIGL